MKSPFPGMDPFLERHWEDVHTRLVSYIADAIQPQLSKDLIARMEEKVYVEDQSERRLRKPDVRVVENRSSRTPALGATVTAVLDEPLLLEPLGDPIRQRSVLIYDSNGRRVVTAIEILSPWNKAAGKAVETYLEKREKYTESAANLVEIDLIRAGDWTDMIGLVRIPERARTTYRVTVTQPELTGVYLYPIPIDARLPTIKIPLRLHDQPAKLNLQELIERAYAMGRYDTIDYTDPLTPALTDPESLWVKEVLAAAGK